MTLPANEAKSFFRYGARRTEACGLRFLPYLSSEHEDGGEIERRHQSDRDVRDLPDGVFRHDGADGGGSAEEERIDNGNFTGVGEIGEHFLSVISPADDGCKRKQNDTQRDDIVRAFPVIMRKRIQNELHTVCLREIFALREQNDEARQRTENDGVEKDLEDAEDPLLGGNFRIRARMRKRRRSTAGFVRKGALRNALTKCRGEEKAENTARSGGKGKRARKHRFAERINAVCLKPKDTDRHQKIDGA